MRKHFLFSLIVLTAHITYASKSTLRIVGSSAAYPYITAAAENFSRDHQDINVIVESTGTGIGFKLFCGANQIKSPELVVSSREMKQNEEKKCLENGSGDLIQIEFGLDGVVLLSSKENQLTNLNKENLFRALYKYQINNNQLEKNNIKYWKQIDISYPNIPIKIYGPPPSSATREEFNHQIMDQGCFNNKKIFEKIQDKHLSCSDIRKDGSYAEIGKNENLIINKVKSNKTAIGITGYNFYSQNIDTIKAIKIDGIEPSVESITSLKYPLSRKLYIYAKNYNDSHTRLVTKKFLLRLVSSFMIGYNGYLQNKGLIPQSEQKITATRKIINESLKN